MLFTSGRLTITTTITKMNKRGKNQLLNFPSILSFGFHPGQVKKNGDKNSNEGSESKEAVSSAAVEPVPNGTTATGGLGTSASRGPLNSHQAIKRTASGDSVTKPPPGKKKKV